MLATVLAMALALDASAPHDTIVRGVWSVRRSTTHAGANRQPTDAVLVPESEAAAAFAAGERSYSRGRYKDAARHFARAHALVPHPATLYNLGLAQQKSGDPVGAWETFDRLAAEATTESEQREAELAQQRLRRRVAILEIQAQAGTSVCLDGRPLDRGTTDRSEHVVEPGTHRLQSGDVDSHLQLDPGETRTVDLEARLALDRQHGPRRAVVPLLATAGLGAAAATGLGIAAATSDQRSTGRGLAAGAAAAAGIAVGTTIAALVILTRKKADRAPPPSSSPCP
jgi:tetratricopeptide (TPR) repeat protein